MPDLQHPPAKLTLYTCHVGRGGPSFLPHGCRRAHEALDEAGVVEDVRIEVREIIDAGDQVVVLATYTARGRGSGAQRQHEDGYVWTLRDEKAVSFEWFHNQADALEAAGLRE